MNLSGSKAKTMMNANPELASTWKGRVLLQCEAYQTEKPVAKTQDVDAAILKSREYIEAIEMKSYSIIAQVGQAVALPSKKHYVVKITVGGFELTFKPFEQKK